jgi:CRISPR-associated exonuclease Cas4
MLDAGLRTVTTETIAKAMAIWQSGKTPQAEYVPKKCDRCSIVDLCMPRETDKGGKNVERYVNNQLRLMRNSCGDCGDTKGGDDAASA